MAKLHVVIVTCILICSSCAQYLPNWESLDSRPLPEWFDEAKIGIFMHFGPYAVPGISSEWFWNSWTNNNSECVNYMSDYFPKSFTYQDFGPMLTMEFFDANWFADLIADSGAKYLVFTSKHHDGFTNWESSYSFGWNSVAVGARRDVLGELKQAFDEKHPELHFGVYYSLFEWYNPLYLKDKSNFFDTREYSMNKMIPELTELVEKYAPHVIFADGEWEATPEYFGTKEFLAWLYNESPSKDHVLVNDRWGLGTNMQHGGYYTGPDRWTPGQLVKHKWESAMTLDSRSWGIRRNMKLSEVLTPIQLLSDVIQTVSYGGNILINVGPTKEGTIVPIFEERLRQMGSWLKVNGEAIYATSPWTAQNDSLSYDPLVWYTSKYQVVYAIALGWPQDEVLTLGSVKADATTTVELLGYQGGTLAFQQQDELLSITFPSMSKYTRQCGEHCQWAYTLKLQNVVHNTKN